MPKIVNKKDAKVSKRGKNEEPKKKRRKNKQKKDPNAPKNPLSAYLLFCDEFREKVRAENKEASFGEIGRLLGEQWRSYSDEQKAPYIEKHQKNKAKFLKEKAAYDAKKGNVEDEDEEEEEEEESD